MTAVTSRRYQRRVRLLLLPLIVAAGFVATDASSQQQPVFRSVVDLIAVDVQVVDPEGNPISQIGPERFEVSIKGQKRKVVSAEFVRDAETRATAKPAPNVSSPAADASVPTGKGRTFILAIDSGSFEIGTEQAPLEAARAFVSHLEPADRVGLYVYPDGAQMAPTTDRAPVRVRLENVIGQKPSLHSYYNLKPFEIVDITTQSTNPNSFLYQTRGPTPASALDPVLRVQQRECPGQIDCPIRIYSEGMTLAVELERQAQTSLAGLASLLRGLADLPGRKSVVLVSAGVIVSDRVDGRPDVGDMGIVMGQIAARANATVYTLHIDAAGSPAAASQRGTGSPELSRDRALQGNWLNAFSAAAGGKLIYVPVGRPDFAFERVLRETAAYYLLGVEPAEADRDGRPRELKVKVNGRGVDIRSRQWVVIPPRS